MRKTTLIALIVLLALAVSVALVCAQGRRAGYGRIGQPCPYAIARPNPDAGGRWTKVQPTTPEQKAFVEKVTRLHKQIREKRLDLANLRATKGDKNRIAALEKDLQRLRAQLHETMYKNRQLRQQMGMAGHKSRMGVRGQGACICATGCPCRSCCPGHCRCDSGKCVKCPCKDQCPCPCGRARAGRGAAAAPRGQMVRPAGPGPCCPRR